MSEQGHNPIGGAIERLAQAVDAAREAGRATATVVADDLGTALGHLDRLEGGGFLSVPQMAERLGVSVRTVRQHADRYRIGRRYAREYLFVEADIAALRRHVGQRGRQEHLAAHERRGGEAVETIAPGDLPGVKVGPRGTITLSQAAVAALGEPAAVVAWLDPETLRLSLRAATDEDASPWRLKDRAFLPARLWRRHALETRLVAGEYQARPHGAGLALTLVEQPR